MTTALRPTIDTLPDFTARLDGVRKSGSRYTANCPAHDDRNASLSIAEGDTVELIVKCHAGCTFEQIMAAAGSPRPAGRSFPFGPDLEQLRKKRGVVAEYDYTDEHGAVLYQVQRYDPKGFIQRKPDGRGGWEYKLNGIHRVPLGLPKLRDAITQNRVVFHVEGEKDALALVKLGITATTLAGGADAKIPGDYAEHFRNARVVVIPDNDSAGRSLADRVARAIVGTAQEVRMLDLPGLPPKGDTSDWLAAGGTKEQLRELVRSAPMYEAVASAEVVQHLPPIGVTPTNEAHRDAEIFASEYRAPLTVDNFWMLAPMHAYIFTQSREMWPGASVNARVAPIDTGRLKKNGDPEVIPASQWIDANRTVEQITWAPGEPEIIEGRLISAGGFIEHPGVRVFNQYRAPRVGPGDPAKAGPWLDHVWTLYDDASAQHFVRWCAHHVQHPGVKVNHALVLGGAQGIGKDTIFEPVKHGVGPWNFEEVSPKNLLGRFNGYLKSVVLRISEGRDLGDVDRYALYEHMKVYTASPPDVLRVDEKNLREYMIPNVCGVVITTNHKTDGLYLPADDRRHFVMWSERTRDDFAPGFWPERWAWYGDGGLDHVAAYLASLDLSGFDPKAPPPKTAAFWDIVDAGRAPEDSELADIFDQLGNPPAVTLRAITDKASTDFAAWLSDRRNARQIPHRMESAGYVAVRNDSAQDGRWKVAGRRVPIYAKRDLSERDRLAAARSIAEGAR